MKVRFLAAFCLSMLALAVPARAQSVVFDHGASATATGAGAAGTPALNFNVTAGQNRVVFITAVFERDHCTTNTLETSATCLDESAANSNFAFPSFVASNGANAQIQFSVTGPGGSLTVTNPLTAPDGDLRFGNMFTTVTGTLATRTAYSQEMFFVALYESQLRTLLGAASTGTITIGLPNVDAPNRAGDDALLSAVQFNHVNQLVTGAAGTGIVRSFIEGANTDCNSGANYGPGVNWPGNWSRCLNGYDAGQAPVNAGDGVLLFGVNGYARSGPMDFATVPGFTEVMNPAVINTDPGTTGTAGAHFLAGTESDGFSTSFQFASGIPAANVEMQSQNGALTASAATSGGMAAKFTLTAAALDLAIAKTDGVTAVASGQSTIYTVAVANNSTVNYADGAVIADPAAMGLTKTAVACTASGGAVCPAGLTIASLESGATIPVLPPGGGLTFTVTATVTATSGSVTNTATIATPAGYVDIDASNNTAQDVDSVQTTFGTCDGRMFLDQVNTPPTLSTLYEVGYSAVPFTYSSLGTGSARNGIGFNPLDNYIYGIEWVGSSGNELIRVGADGSSVNLGAITGLPSSNYNNGVISPAGDYYVMSGYGGTTMYRIDIATRTATMLTLSTSIQVSDFAWYNGLLYGVSGGQLVSVNPATGAVATIGSTSPIGVAIAMWGFSNGLFATSGGSIYAIDPATGKATLASTAPSSSNADGANCSAAPITFDADLSVTKTNTPASGANDLVGDTYVPGSVRTYTIVVSNTSTSFGAQNVTVSDPVPAGIDPATVSWTCTATSGGATCGAVSGSGALNDTGLDLPPGAVATYQLTMTVPAGYTGDLTNTVTVTPPDTINDANTANNTATDVDHVTARLTIRKISVGGVDSFGFTGTNGVVAQTLTTTTAGTPVAGATQLLTASGTTTTVTESTSPVTYQVSDITCTGLGAGGTATPDLANRTVVLDAAATAAGANIECTFTNTLQQTDLQVVKTADPGTVISGEVVTYRIVVSNNGPLAATNVLLTDTAGAGQDCTTPSTTATCTATAGASCPSPTVPVSSLLGSGITIPTLPVGGQVTVELQCTVTASGS